MPIDLAKTQYDGGVGSPMLIAHGLLGHARNWSTLGKRFSQDRSVTCVDMRNHGDSPWHDEMTYPAMGGDLGLAVKTSYDRPAIVLGHSMGGKAAMAAALSEPERVRALIVADIAPMAYAHNYDAEFSAMRAVDPTQITRRSQADAILRDHVSDPMMRAFLLQNLAISNETVRWRPNIDALSANMSALVGWQEPDGAQPYDGPALFLGGAKSDYVRTESHAEIKRLFPNAEIEYLADAGHWLHAEQPDGFFDAVTAFLARI